MLKIVATLAAFATTAVIGAAMLSPNERPAQQAEDEPHTATPSPAEPLPQAHYDYQTVWALFEESCRADEFMDDECDCLMDSVSGAHGMDAAAYLALMGWDRFEEAGAIAERLGEDHMEAAFDFYIGKADGACARESQPLTDPGSSSVRADAEVTPTSGPGEFPAGTVPRGQNGARGEPDETTAPGQAGQTDTHAPNCTLDTAISVPGNLGMPLVHVTNGQARPLHQLSAGNQQRVGLGRTIIEAPPLLILDEADASMSAAEIEALESCAIYTGGQARFDIGSQREFTGKLTTPGTDLAATAGAEYVVWNTETASASRFPLGQPFALPASSGTQIILLDFTLLPAPDFSQARISLEPTDTRLRVVTEMSSMALLWVVAQSELHLRVLAWFLGIGPPQPLPVNEVLLVPAGEVELSWEDGEIGDETGREFVSCFASQHVLIQALRSQGHDSESAFQSVKAVIDGARREGKNVCNALALAAMRATLAGGDNWRLNIPPNTGAGVLFIDTTD